MNLDQELCGKIGVFKRDKIKRIRTEEGINKVGIFLAAKFGGIFRQTISISLENKIDDDCNSTSLLNESISFFWYSVCLQIFLQKSLKEKKKEVTFCIGS